MPPSSLAQAKKKAVGKKSAAAKKITSKSKSAPVAIFRLEESPPLVPDPPKYLWHEPCAKETGEQIAELESAKNSAEQVRTLSDRLANNDEWVRGCALYRLGTFKSYSAPALPLIIKLLRDDRTEGMFHLASDAIYSIPPPPVSYTSERLDLAKSLDVYNRIYGLWALGYFKPMAGAMDLKEIVNALIDGTRDEDPTARWVAVNGITRIGFAARAAVPALIELLQKKSMNPVDTIIALGRMDSYMTPALPALFDALNYPEKYTSDKNRRSVIYLTTTLVLAKLGKQFIPVLEKEFDKHPFSVLGVVRQMSEGDISPIILKGLKSPNKELRKTSLDFYAYETPAMLNILPVIIPMIDDPDLEIRKSAISRIGSIAKYGDKNSPELKNQLEQKALPMILRVAQAKNNEASCYAAFTIADFGPDKQNILILSKMITPNGRLDYCAATALFRLGEEGRKFLTPERIKEMEKNEQSVQNILKPAEESKAKPIAPKTPPAAEKVLDN
jgi:HEAT repeat protein